MATHVSGFRSAFIAFFGNACLAILKSVGFLLSGSTALFSEAVHSIADTANQGLLLVGVHRSKKAADEMFAYGYGNERFLWALISACGIFFVGAGVTLYEGFESLYANTIPELSPIIFLILAASLVVEGYAFYAAFRELRGQYPDETLTDIFELGDPVTIAVIYEDAVAVLGVFIALMGITGTYLTQNSVWDGIASILIGLLLACIAVLLIKKNREYLIGKSIPEEEKELIIEILQGEPYIERVVDFKSSILDIGKYHIKCEVEFNGAALTDELGDLRDEFDEIDGNYETFKKFVAYSTNRIPRIMGRKIDEVEKKVIAAFPSVRHIDIEIN